MFGRLTIHHPAANFLQCTCAKTYENWLRGNKVIATKMVAFMAHSAQSSVENCTVLFLAEQFQFTS